MRYAVQAIRLAIISCAYDALPAAFYELCLTSWRTDRSLNTTSLRAEELRCILYGQKTFMGRFDPGGDSYLPTLLHRLTPLPCPNDLECLDGMIQWIHEFSQTFPGFVIKGFDPLLWIMNARDDLAARKFSDGFTCCDGCNARMCTVFDAERAQIWSYLEEYFSLVSLFLESFNIPQWHPPPIDTHSISPRRAAYKIRINKLSPMRRLRALVPAYVD